MADEGFVVGGGGPGAAAPLAYTVPGTGEVILKAAFARMDGTAAGAFLPCIRIKTPNGTIMLEVVGTSVAAGASADITWFPGIGTAAAAGIQFNTSPQSGSYLDVTTTGADAGNNGMLFTDTGGHGINFVGDGTAGGVHGPYDAFVHIGETETGAVGSFPFAVASIVSTGLTIGADIDTTSNGNAAGDNIGMQINTNQNGSGATGAALAIQSTSSQASGSGPSTGVQGNAYGGGSGTLIGVQGLGVTTSGFTGLAVGLSGQVITSGGTVPATSLPLQVLAHGGGNLLLVQDNGRILMNALPTSSAGLASGSLWNNAGVVNIV